MKKPIPDEVRIMVYSDIPNHRRDFVLMEPGHWPPEDDTTVIVVDSGRAVHRANAYSVRIGRMEFMELTGWLTRVLRHGSGQRQIRGSYTDALLWVLNGRLQIEIVPSSGSFGFTTTLGKHGTKILSDWMTDKDINGWSGWKSGRTGEPEL